MSNEVKNLSKILNSLPDWNRWNNYKDIYDTEQITNSFIDNVLLPDEEDTILDFGAGFAMNEYFAKKKGFKIDSLDIDTEEVRKTFKKVHEKLGLETYLYDGVTIPFGDNTYNKIIFKASLTKMRQSDLVNIFEELLRISKPDAVWYVSPPYMMPRFVTSAVKRIADDWCKYTSSKRLLSEIAKKRVVIVMNDWVKRSTFAFGSEKTMNSSIGWMPENTFDFDAMRVNYKFGYKKAQTFFVNVYSLPMMYEHAFMNFLNTGAYKNWPMDHNAGTIANKDLQHFGALYTDNLSLIRENANTQTIKSATLQSKRYSGKTYILARGKSSNQIEYKDICAKQSDTVIYVNDWKKLLTKYEYSRFSEKSINVHFLNRDIDLNKLSDRQYFDKTIALVQSNSENTELDIARKLASFCYGMQQKFAQIPQGEIQTKVKTAGLHAVFYAVEVLKRKDVEIFGLDFFEANYLTEHVVSKKPEPLEYQPAKGKIAKEQFIALVKSNPDVNFKIHTYADFSNIKAENLIVNQLKE